MARRYNTSIRKILLGLIGSITIVAGTLSWNSRATLSDLPHVMLWAWERPEDLSFLDCRLVGVAVLAETITLTATRVGLEPRRQPVNAPPGCATVAVVRIEAAEGATTLPDRIQPIGRELLRIAGRDGIRALQIDFDATVSQRPFYRGLLQSVREEMPDGVALTITALTSWCLFDNWIDDLPIDDAVPMLFDMGADDARVRTYLKSGGTLRSRKCQNSLGVSVQEPPLNVPKGRRIFVFHSRPWTPQVVSSAHAWAGGFQ